MLVNRLRPEVNDKRWTYLQHFKGAGPRILLMQRAALDPFYVTQESEVRSSGAQRRSIPNLHAGAAVVTQVHDNLLTAALEKLQLADQMALFSVVDIVIAQHGAALGNMLWMRRGTYVIEIATRRLRPFSRSTISTAR